MSASQGFGTHKHHAGCYGPAQKTCPQAEHRHNGGCYNADNKLICGRFEHAHDSTSCYEQQKTCGQP